MDPDGKPFPFIQPMDGGQIDFTSPSSAQAEYDWKPLDESRKIFFSETIDYPKAWTLKVGDESDKLAGGIAPLLLCASPRLRANPLVWQEEPREYTLSITFDRNHHATWYENDRGERIVNKEQDKAKVCIFSGVVKPGGYFSIRLDAFFENMKMSLVNRNLSLYEFYFHVRVRSTRSLEVDYVNTATRYYKISNDKYEFVSKELLALNSEYYHVLFYAPIFTDNRMRATLKRKLNAETVKNEESAVRMMLEWIHYRTFTHVTPTNAHLLIDVLECLGIRAINKHLDKHMSLYCRKTKEEKMLDATILLCQVYDLPETEKLVPFHYGSPAKVSEAFDRLRDRLTADNLELLFDAYRRDKEQTHFARCTHIYFEFESGCAIVQLYRVGAPADVWLLNQLSPAPRFYWQKENLVSVNPVSTKLRPLSWDKGPESVPEDTYAFVMYNKDDGYHFMLTKSRPRATDAIYLGYLVKGAEILNKQRPPKYLGAGLYYV